MENVAPFIIYDASAGSGKTFTLVRNYLTDLLLANSKSAYRNNLAITFTNKAVIEMKGRVINSLYALSQPQITEEYRSILQALQKTTGFSTAKIQEKSKAILRSILHNYAAFDISTIDSFTHRLLQTFAKDLGLPTNFEVELDTDQIISEAVDRLISKAGDDRQLTNILIDFSLTKIDDDRSWDISRDLNETAKLITQENNFPYIEILREKTFEDFSRFAVAVQEAMVEAEKKRIKTAEKFFTLIKAHHIEPEDFSGKKIPKHFEKIISNNWVKPSTAGWAKDMAEAKIYNKGLAEEKKGIIDSLRPAIGVLYKTAEEAYYRKEFLEKILKGNTALSLLVAVEREVNTIKNERGLLLISEFYKKISDQIKDQPSPFIYERLGERYRTFYIDEFQDTSILQWQNLKPLLADSIASGKGKLTIVGDAKQAIYRWRGGKPELFIALTQHLNPFHTTKKVVKLPNNYRSFSQIVAFNNDLFTHIAPYFTNPSYQELYADAAQNVKKKTSGLVDIQFIEAEKKEEKIEKYPQEVLQLIQRLESQGYPYSHICVLIRKKEQGRAVADLLSQHNIPLVSSDSLLLKKSPKVQFIINLLSFSLRPTDKNIKFDLLNFLFQYANPPEDFFKFTDSRIAKNGGAFFASLKDYFDSFSLQKLQYLPIYEAVMYSVRAFQLLKKSDTYVQFLLDFVYEYSQQHSGGISGFIELWELKKDNLSVVLPEDENAVQIMTIHRSKGLEFPIVIYPFANEKLNDTSKDTVWIPLTEEPNDIQVARLQVSKDLSNYGDAASSTYEELLLHKELDAMNLAYVAMTRAKEQLYILSDINPKKEILKDDKPHTLSEFLVHYLMTNGCWEEDERHYTFGEMPTPPQQEELHFPEASQEFIPTDPKTHTYTLVTKSGKLWGTVQEKAITHGNTMHQLLQGILTVKDLEKVVEEAVLYGLILAGEKKIYTQKLTAVITHPQLKEYFSEKYTIYTEKEIIVDHAYKRLDRLCINSNKAVIIDYKTGEHYSKYQKQLNDYAAALEKIGYQVQQKLLVYLEDKIKIDNVS